MAENDWAEMDDGLDANTVKRGVTNGVARPTGGGNFVFGFNSIATNDLNPGAVGYYADLADVNPAAKGGTIRGALQRGVSAGGTDYAVMLVAALQGSAPPSVNNSGYILGLSDADPGHIVLRKGAISEGVPDVSAGSQGVLRRSTETVAIGSWLHVRLDVIVNLNGDVILQCFKNTGSVAAPSWEAIAGMDSFTDDVLAINSGSVPYTSGFFGFAYWMKNISRRAFVDHIELSRQL